MTTWASRFPAPTPVEKPEGAEEGRTVGPDVPVPEGTYAVEAWDEYRRKIHQRLDWNAYVLAKRKHEVAFMLDLLINSGARYLTTPLDYMATIVMALAASYLEDR